MFKKLVKYGNSNALILDRAILELLNIGEGSVVKLHTDGKSLTITPEEPVNQKEVLMTGVEMMQAYVQNKRSLAEADLGNAGKAGAVAHAERQEKVQKIMEKYTHALTSYDHQAFLAHVDQVAEKYNGNRLSPEFIEEVKMLQLQYSPDLAAMQKELAELV